MRGIAGILIAFLIVIFIFVVNYNKSNKQGLSIVNYDFQTVNGDALKLKDNRVGYYLLYFGFTKCPDVCPRVLSKMNHILNDLNISSKIAQSYFITLDIKRDNTDDIKDFLQPYNNFIGLIPDNIIHLNKIKDEMGIYAKEMTYAEYFQDKSLENQTEYLINHTSVVYILDNVGRIVHVINPVLEDKQIKHILQKHILKEHLCGAC